MISAAIRAQMARVVSTGPDRMTNDEYEKYRIGCVLTFPAIATLVEACEEYRDACAMDTPSADQLVLDASEAIHIALKALAPYFTKEAHNG